MRTQQINRLKALCLENALDPQLIDSSLSYGENKDYLESLIGKTVEQLALEYGRTYEKMDKHLPIKERYGLSFEELEPPTTHEARYRAVIKYRFRAILNKGQSKAQTFKKYIPMGKRTEVIKNRLDLCKTCAFMNCQSKISVTVKKDIIIVKGNSASISSIKLRLDRTGIFHRIVKVKRIDKGVMWLQGVGWIKKPESPKPLFWGVNCQTKKQPKQ